MNNLDGGLFSESFIVSRNTNECSAKMMGEESGRKPMDGGRSTEEWGSLIEAASSGTCCDLFLTSMLGKHPLESSVELEAAIVRYEFA